MNKQSKASGQCRFWKASHDSLFISTFITKPIICAMVAWFYHYQAIVPIKKLIKEVKLQIYFSYWVEKVLDWRSGHDGAWVIWMGKAPSTGHMQEQQGECGRSAALWGVISAGYGSCLDTCGSTVSQARECCSCKYRGTNGVTWKVAGEIVQIRLQITNMNI